MWFSRRQKWGGIVQLGLERPFLTRKVLCKWNGMPWKLVTNRIGSTVEDELEELWMGGRVDDFSTSDSMWFRDHRLAFLYLSRESHHHIKCPRVLLSVLGRPHWEKCWIAECICLLEMQESIGRGPAVFVIHGPGRTISWHVWQVQPCCLLLLCLLACIWLWGSCHSLCVVQEFVSWDK